MRSIQLSGKSLKLSCLAVVIAGLSACGSDSYSGSGAATTNTATAGTGKFSLAVTDAPIDSADHVVVQFTGVEIKPKDGAAKTFTFAQPKSIDLLKQQGGNSAPLLTDESLAAGEYESIRLAVKSVEGEQDTYIVVSGAEHEMEVPSGSTSGLKLNASDDNPITVPADGAASFTIDFDLRHSIVHTGNDKYKLKPVLRLINNTGSATVKGTVDATTLVSAQCANASLNAGAVYLFTSHDVTPDDVDGQSPEPIASAKVNYNEQTAVYEYVAAFIKAGNYTLSYTCGDDNAEVDDALTFAATRNITLAESETQTQNLQ
ncbi:MAG: DUF4382 domain-containing protein [Hahellaceae bacterium]|nr:DUF4382 domain-containing protein [Hahellaceae bacterium]MCP5168261.1 DUF4382 domain-containing protein [Hahellaceae bacterium]